MIGCGPEPVDKIMYNRIKARVKKEWQKKSRWPSAYGSAHLVKEYKKAFKNKNGNKNPYKGATNSNLSKKKSKKVKSKKVKSKIKKSKKIDCRLKKNKSKSACKKKMSGGKIDCRFKNNKGSAICKKKSKKVVKKSKKVVNKSKKSLKVNKDSSGLKRWFGEKWVNVCKKKKDGSYATCGRKKSSLKNYPYCRPFRRINSKTPMTVGEMVKKYGKKKIQAMCNKKNNKKDVKSNTYM